MTALSKKIQKKVTKLYNEILKMLIEDISKKYNIDVNELERVLQEEDGELG